MVTCSTVSLLYISLWTVIFLATAFKFSSACRSHHYGLKKSNEFTYEEQNINVCALTGNSELEIESCYNRKVKCDSSLVGLHLDDKRGKLTVTYELKQLKLEKLLKGELDKKSMEKDQLENNINQLDIDLYDCGKEINPSILENGTFNKRNCLKHSSKFFYINWSNTTDNSGDNQHCSKKITVTFDHVYSSTYFVRINTCLCDRCLFSCPVVLKSNYEPDYLASPKHNLQNAPVCIKNSENFLSSTYVLNLKLIESVLNKPRANFTIRHDGSLIFSCKRERENLEWDCIHNNESYDCSDGMEEKVYRNISHLFFCRNVPEGLYHYTMTYNDMRCRVGTVWTNFTKNSTTSGYCQWDEEIICADPYSEAKNGTSIYEVSNTIEITLFTIVSVCMIICLSASIICFVRWKKENEPDVKIGTDPTEHPYQSPFPVIPEPGQEKNVFLVYARDISSFHETMDRFREVLKHYNCKVSDIWDVSQAKEITRKNFEAWVIRNIEISYCIIVVESTCALELEYRHTKGKEGHHYIIPDNFDGLFTFAMIALRKRQYTRDIRVVRIGEQKYINNSISKDRSMNNRNDWGFLPNVSSLHCLPTQLGLLLCELNCVKDMEIETEPDRPNEIKKFQEAANKYIEEVTNDPTCAEKILNYDTVNESVWRNGNVQAVC